MRVRLEVGILVPRFLINSRVLGLQVSPNGRTDRLIIAFSLKLLENRNQRLENFGTDSGLWQ